MNGKTVKFLRLVAIRTKTPDRAVRKVYELRDHRTRGRLKNGHARPDRNGPMGRFLDDVSRSRDEIARAIDREHGTGMRRKAGARKAVSA